MPPLTRRPRCRFLRRLRVLTTLATLLAAAPAAHAVTGDWHENEQSRVRLVTPYATAPASGEIHLGLDFETAPGWHVYWKNAGDAGYAPAVDLAPTPRLSRGEILWPAPERFELPGDLVAFGYEGQVIYPLRARLDPAGDVAGAITLAVDLDYLVCEVHCVPYSYRLSVEQPLAPPGGEPVADPQVEPRLAAWERRVPLPVEAVAGAGTGASLDLTRPDHPELVVRVEGVDGAPDEEPDLFLETHDLFDAARPRLERRDGRLVFRVPLTFRQRPDELPAVSDFAWTVTGLEDGAGGALALAAARTVEARLPGSTPPAGAAPSAGAPSVAGLLLLAVLGGLLLHLTPTLLPLLVGGWAALAQAEEGTVARRRALASAAGCLAAAGALEPLIAAARGAGRFATWGAQLREPLLLAALALAAALLALALWGFVPGLLRRGDGRGATPPGGLLLGAVTVFFALAWNLPPLSRALGAALARGRGTALAVCLALGLGLALPYLAVALAPGLLRRLPRPSRRWLEGLGFLAAAGALWLLLLLSRQVTAEGLAYVELALLGVGLAAWLASTARRRRWSAAWGALLVLLSVATVWLAVAHRQEGSGVQGALSAPQTEILPPKPIP